MFPSAVFALVLHISPSVKCGDKRVQLSSLKLPSAATLGEAKCWESFVCLLILTSVITTIHYSLFTKRNGTLARWHVYSICTPVLRKVERPVVVPLPSLTFSIRWSLIRRRVLLRTAPSLDKPKHRITSSLVKVSGSRAKAS